MRAPGSRAFFCLWVWQFQFVSQAQGLTWPFPVSVVANAARELRVAHRARGRHDRQSAPAHDREPET